ncbi:MAG TPA: hypothetical protein VG734_10880 [Lacunisphaera sp.]|nr:hypothetical protein [Lacunisphaera sp.]
MSNTAKADPTDFTFTGMGTNGTVAHGSFTTSTILDPFYFSNGAIYSAFSLTLTNIPGSGPSSVTFGLDDLQSSWLSVDGSGAVFIAPYGSYNYGGPFFDHYDLGQPAQPYYPGSFTYQTILYYDGEHGYRDTITWSTATVVSSSAAVPETGSTFAMFAGAAAVLVAGVRRGRRLDHPTWAFRTSGTTGRSLRRKPALRRPSQ